MALAAIEFAILYGYDSEFALSITGDLAFITSRSETSVQPNTEDTENPLQL